MASLLRHEAQAGTEQIPNSYPPQSFKPVSENMHPLHFSEMNPSAPVHHLYQPPQPSNYDPNPRYQAAPVLVPVQTPHISLDPIQYGGPPAPRRQSKKISQRRADLPKKDQDQVNRSSASLDDRRDEPPNGTRSPDQDLISQSTPRKASESSMAQGFSQQDSQKRAVPISNLLSASSEADRPAPRYILTIRQQPQSARACGYGERDRRVVDPPPILVLDVENPFEGRAETYVVHCVLWNADTNTDASAMPESNERRQQRRLMGTNVASPFPAKDENNEEKVFFTFADVSVRTPGTYRLKFNLCVLDLMKQGPGSRNPVPTTVMSDPFQVFNAKDFGGMRASSALTKSLKAQGCLIPVKKGNTRANTHSKNRNEEDEDEEEEEEEDMDDEDDDMTKPPRPGKRAKR